MEQYSIYCTKEQTKKALELGAPIKFKTICHYDLQDGKFIPYPDLDIDINGDPILIPPTAEQMRNWLEDIFSLRFYCGEDSDGFIFVNIYSPQERIAKAENCISPIQAALAAIDAALDYLIKNKK